MQNEKLNQQPSLKFGFLQIGITALFIIAALGYFFSLQTNGDCSYRYVESVVYQKGLQNLVNLVGEEDGNFVELYENTDTVIVDMGREIESGETYFIIWRNKSGTTPAQMDLLESIDNSSFHLHSNPPRTEAYPDWDKDFIIAESSFRYLMISKGSHSEVDFEIDAIGAVSICDREIWDNGLDDDGDGLIDCEDPDCMAKCEEVSCTTSYSDNLIALYTFTEGAGDTIFDKSAFQSPLHLVIKEGSSTQWLNGVGLSVNAESWIESIDEAEKIYDAVLTGSGLTLEAWVKPANKTQSGPARIINMARHSTERNFTLGQSANRYINRMRTSETSSNGTGELKAPKDSLFTAYIQHLVYTWDINTGQEYMYLDGKEVVNGIREGNLSVWEELFKLSLVNEFAANSRPWLGELYRIAIYNQPLGVEEIRQNYEAGFGCGKSINSEVICGNGRDMEVVFDGIKNNLPASLAIENQGNIDSIIVEVSFDNNDQNSVSISDQNGNTYTATKTSVSTVDVYRAVLPPVSAIFFSDQSRAYAAEGIAAYVFRSGLPYCQIVDWVPDVGGYRTLEKFGYKLPISDTERDIRVSMPVTELSYDDRVLNFRARVGSKDTAFSVQWGPKGRTFPNGCCMDLIEFTLKGIEGNASQLVLEVESPSGTPNGQSFALVGLISITMDPPDDYTFPVEWAYFTAKQIGKEAQILWGTNREINHDFFQVERSIDQTTFSPIGIVAGKGNSGQNMAYSFTDQNLPGGIEKVFYRLKQVDFDGSFSYSETVELNYRANSFDLAIQIYPNPANESFSMTSQYLDKEPMDWVLINPLGQVVQKGTLNGLKSVEVKVQSLPRGTYILRVQSEDKLWTERLVLN